MPASGDRRVRTTIRSTDQSGPELGRRPAGQFAFVDLLAHRLPDGHGGQGQLRGHRGCHRWAATGAPVPTGSVTMSVRAQEMGNVSVGGSGRMVGGRPAGSGMGWRGRLGGVVSPVEAADVSSAPVGPAAVRGRQARTELVVGVALVAAVVAVGAVYARRTVAGPFDRWVLDIVPSGGGGWFTPVTWLRYPPVTVVGSIVAAAAVFRRDRPRAVACLVGPTLALVTCELVVKPAVGRTLGGVYSYPSGSTAGVAALSTAAVLATTIRWRCGHSGGGVAGVAVDVDRGRLPPLALPDRRVGRPGLRGRRGAGDRRRRLEGLRPQGPADFGAVDPGRRPRARTAGATGVIGHRMRRLRPSAGVRRGRHHPLACG